MSKVRVSAPARIHMGILNPSPAIGSRFYASVGVGVEQPRTVVEVKQANKLNVSGLSLQESDAFARKILDHYKLQGATIRVISLPPRHAGLGSTTQLSLSIALGITKVYGLKVQPTELAMVLGRGKQSAIGTYVFQQGGFVVEGGWGHKTSFPPLLFRYPFPEDWWFLIIVPKSRSIDEKKELEVFDKLPAPEERLVHEACYRILLGMAPAILEKNIQSFGENLSALQELVGAMFSQAQGGVFQPRSAPLIEKLRDAGAIGVGQSSWGPAVYALLDSSKRKAMEKLLKDEILYSDSIKEFNGAIWGASGWGEICLARADNKGAVVTSSAR